MTKEEILLNARREGDKGMDEGTKQSRNKGVVFGRALFNIVFVCIAVSSLIFRKEIPLVVWIMYLACISGDVAGFYYNSGKKGWLVFLIAEILVVAVGLVFIIKDLAGI